MGKFKDLFIRESVSAEQAIESLDKRADTVEKIIELQQQVEEAETNYHHIREQATELGWVLLNSQYGDSITEHGAAAEITIQERRKRNRRAEEMYREEAIVRRAVNVSNEYVWGRGMQKPAARDPRVQRVIDAFWADPDNQLVISSLNAQIQMNTDLELHGELFFLVFDEGTWGSLGIDVEELKDNPNKQNSLLGFSDSDAGQESYIKEHLVDEQAKVSSESSWEYIEDFSGGSFKVTITDPKLPECPVKLSRIHPNQITNIIRFKNQGLKTRYFQRERPEVVFDFKSGNYIETGETLTTYYENFEFPASEYNEENEPVAPNVAKGRIYHCAVNKGAFGLRGNADIWPTLKWANLLNDFYEWRMTLLKARATFAFKRKIKGGPQAVLQSAARMVNQTPGARFSGVPGQNQPRPTPGVGSIVTENEAENLEQFQIKGDSGDAAGDILSLRAQAGLAVGLPAWYVGDAQGANLANSTSMEFPVLKRFAARQEFFEKIIEKFLDHAIMKAVRENLIPETADLSYKNDLPNIQERNIPELVNSINQIVSRLDPFSLNYKLKRFLLLQGLIYLGINNPQKIVQDIYPPEAEREETEKMMSMGMLGSPGAFTGNPEVTQPEIPKSELDPMKHKKQNPRTETTVESEIDQYEEAMSEMLKVLDKFGVDEIERLNA